MNFTGKGDNWGGEKDRYGIFWDQIFIQVRRSGNREGRGCAKLGKLTNIISNTN